MHTTANELLILLGNIVNDGLTVNLVHSILQSYFLQTSNSTSESEKQAMDE